MAYEQKEPHQQVQQYGGQSPPPQYGAQAPPPMGQPMSQPMYPQHSGQMYTASTPPAEIQRTYSGQQYQQPSPIHQQPSPVQQPQYAAEKNQYDQYPQQGQYPQQPQPAHGQPPQQGYPQQQQQQQQQQQGAHTAGHSYQTVVPLASLSASPAPTQCPSCGQRGMTRTAFVTGNTTHGWAAGLCFLLCLGCIPYLINGMKDVEHRCGNCGVHLATWHRSGRTEVHMFS